MSCLVVLCVLLRLNFWFFSGNCRPCLRVVQLPERTTGPTSQETPTTLPAGNEGSQAYSLCYPVCSQGSTGPPGPILRNPTTLPAGNEDSQAYSTSSGNCKTLPAGSTSPRKDHLALFRETSRPCLRVMKAPRPTLLLRGTVRPCLRVVQIPERTIWPFSGGPHDPACG